MRKLKSNLWETGKYLIPFVLFAALSSVLPVEYSFTITSEEGSGEKDPSNLSEDELRGFMVHEIDTVLHLSATDEIPMFIENCGEVGFFRVQVTQSLSGYLLHVISFGRKRQVKVKYVCIKPSESYVTPWQ